MSNKKSDAPKKEMVRYILHTIPETRDDDILLMIEIWRFYYVDKIYRNLDGDEYVRLKDLKSMPDKDTVKRYRAKFNQQGLYVSENEEVLRQRLSKEKRMLEEMRKNI